MEKLTLQKLEGILWNAADILRGELNAAQYMDYIFGLLFLKRMNDQFDVEKELKIKEFKEMGIPEEELDELVNDPNIYENFFVPNRARLEYFKELNFKYRTRA